MNLLATSSVLIKCYGQFCMVGASGVFVDMAILYLLAHPSMLACNLTLSKLIAAETAIFNNFLWNDQWTFRHVAFTPSSWKRYGQRFLQFNLICLTGLGISVLLLNLQVRLLQMNLLLANLIAIASASLWNYLLSLKFAWTAADASVVSHKRLY